jgi:hypothetical protein
MSNYGLLQMPDGGIVSKTLEALSPKPLVRVLEIGVFTGETAIGMKRFLEEHGSTIDYWGIDPGLLIGKQIDLPFPGAHLISGRSERSFHLVPDNFDLIFVDGNHCRNGVVLDIVNYSPKVVPGGFMVFHDTSPHNQGIIIGNFQRYCEPDCPEIPEFYIAVLDAFRVVHWPWTPWTLFCEYAEKDSLWGARSYRNGP